jgi:hypothetical protein
MGFWVFDAALLRVRLLRLVEVLRTGSEWKSWEDLQMTSIVAKALICGHAVAYTCRSVDVEGRRSKT